VTYDEALSNFFDTPDLTVERCMALLLHDGYDPGTAYQNLLDFCVNGLLGHKAQGDLSLDIAFYGVGAAAVIRDLSRRLA
jgi:hypothetical protein